MELAPDPRGQPGLRLQVDPDTLRSMAHALGEEANELRTVKADPGADEAGAAVTSSPIDTACDGGTRRVETALVVVSRIDHIISMVRSSADAFEFTDESFAEAMKAMGEL